MILRAYIILIGVTTVLTISSNRSFVIDHENNGFLKDGQPFKFISASMQYQKVPRGHWEDRMRKLRAIGIGALQFYVTWSLHEIKPGQFTFEDNLDIFEFMKLASSLGFLIKLRIGPYTCGEMNFGGVPAWIIQKFPDINIRSSNKNWLKRTNIWWNAWLPKIRHLLYSNGGPIIMVQLENEYAYVSNTDEEYKRFLMMTAQQYLGNDVIYYTTGPSDTEIYLRKGKTKGAFFTTDFGADLTPMENFKLISQFQKKGPLINSEYWTGWFDYWGKSHSKADHSSYLKGLEIMLNKDTHVNFYLGIGGTLFGFNPAEKETGQFVTTSYDFSCLLSEAGDLTEFYYDAKMVLSKYFPLPSISHNGTLPKGAYGKVFLKLAGTIFDATHSAYVPPPTSSEYPLSFEYLKQSNGFILYQHIIDGLHMDPAILSIPNVKDRGYVYVNKEFRGILAIRLNDSITELPVDVQPGDELSVFVENFARSDGSFSTSLYFKGILSNVSLGGHVLTNWTQYQFPFESMPALKTFALKSLNKRQWNSFFDDQIHSNFMLTRGRGSFWFGTFYLPCNETVYDTFLYLPDWRKGLAIVNDFNLGHYWPAAGPQLTLYVPSTVLKTDCKQKNSIILFEQEGTPCFKKEKCYVEFVKTHVIDGPTTKA